MLRVKVLESANPVVSSMDWSRDRVLRVKVLESAEPDVVLATGSGSGAPNNVSRVKVVESPYPVVW